MKSKKIIIALFWGIRLFKVIVVGTSPPGKLLSSACYDKQQVCDYLQSATVRTLNELIAVK